MACLHDVMDVRYPGNHGVALVQGVGVRGYRQRNGTAQQEKTDEV